MADDNEKVVAEFEKGATEIVRASIKAYKRKTNIALRIYYMDEQSGEWRPTKKGVYLPTDYMPELKRAIEALEAGLKEMESQE